MKRITVLIVAFIILSLSCGFVAIYDVAKNTDEDVVVIDGHLTEKYEPMRPDMAD